MENPIIVEYLEISQPIGKFYIAKMSWKDLICIAEADIRQIEKETNNGTNFESYLGIQREVSKNRKREIGKYVRTVDATFPTSIILSINSESYYLGDEEERISDFENFNKELIKEENIIFYEESKQMFIRRSAGIAKILDGQHRIEGLKEGFLNGELWNTNEENFDLNITIFVDIDIDDQAQIFSVINKAQTKVNKSLVYDLYEYAKSRSPQKTAHDIVRLLNRKQNSPFYKKVKILGKANDKSSETIAQATFAELIINYISKDPMTDRDLLKRKKKLKNDLPKQRYIFRDFFLTNQDEYIAKNIWNYFEAISKRWPIAWNKNEHGNIINKSTGIVAFSKFFIDIYNSLEQPNIVKTETFSEFFEKVPLNDSDFNPEQFKPGSSGQSALYKKLKEVLDQQP